MSKLKTATCTLNFKTEGGYSGKYSHKSKDVPDQNANTVIECLAEHLGIIAESCGIDVETFIAKGREYAKAKP